VPGFGIDRCLAASSSLERLCRSFFQRFGCTAATTEKVAIEGYDFSVADGNCQYIYFRLRVNEEEVFDKVFGCAPVGGPTINVFCNKIGSTVFGSLEACQRPLLRRIRRVT